MVTKTELYAQYLADLQMITEKYQFADDDEYERADVERRNLKKQYNEDLAFCVEDVE